MAPLVKLRARIAYDGQLGTGQQQTMEDPYLASHPLPIYDSLHALAVRRRTV